MEGVLKCTLFYMKLYHVTTPNLLPSITKNGLCLSYFKTGCTQRDLLTDNEDCPKIYLTNDWETLIKNDSDFWGWDLVVLEVEYKGSLNVDKEYPVELQNNMFWIEENIPPEHITVFNQCYVTGGMGKPIQIILV